jgi:L-ascorbate metabolism protein UlaG (beta-lactamase superfamily)
MLDGADVIVRVTADDYAAPPVVGQHPAFVSNLVRFTVHEALKGSIESRDVLLPGTLTERDDFNDQPPPYPAIRMAGRRGNCVATDYRRGASFLLFLERTADGYRVYPEALGPVNEQLHSANDGWVQWVRTTLASSPSAAGSTSQVQNPDVILARTSGFIRVVPLGHGSLALVHGQGVVLVDPARFVPAQPEVPKEDLQTMATAYLAAHGAPPPPSTPDEEPVAELLASAAPIRAGQLTRFEGLPAPTLILLTHTHTDHLDPRVIQTLRGPNTRVIVPTSATTMMLDVTGAETMTNGERKAIGEFLVEAVPMYNPAPDPKLGTVFHPRGRGNGYVVTMGGSRIYVAGDTGCTPEMRSVANIDIAFVPMNLPYTMTPTEAAACVRALRPKIVYPYHYFDSDPRAFAAALRGSDIEVRIRDWYSNR